MRTRMCMHTHLHAQLIGVNHNGIFVISYLCYSDSIQLSVKIYFYIGRPDAFIVGILVYLVGSLILRSSSSLSPPRPFLLCEYKMDKYNKLTREVFIKPWWNYYVDQYLKFKQMVTLIVHLPEQPCQSVLSSYFTFEETKAEKGEYNPLWVHSFILFPINWNSWYNEYTYLNNFPHFKREKELFEYYESWQPRT